VSAATEFRPDVRFEIYSPKEINFNPINEIFNDVSRMLHRDAIDSAKWGDVLIQVARSSSDTFQNQSLIEKNQLGWILSSGILLVGGEGSAAVGGKHPTQNVSLQNEDCRDDVSGYHVHSNQKWYAVSNQYPSLSP
jgi:hypothetical protein